MSLLEVLEKRGYVVGHTEPRDELEELLETGPLTFYAGIDPTADSLHVGHFGLIMLMRLLQRAGHRPILVLGGATAQVGDPSGKSQTRTAMAPEQVMHNLEAIQNQLTDLKLITFGDNGAIMLDNSQWLNMPLLTYLREVAAHFPVPEMLRRDTFARRLEGGLGLSLLEFLYPTLQAADFVYLHDEYNCQLQLGGADQWGNITDGVELARRTRRTRLHGMVTPLLMGPGGVKMGKTAGGDTIWLDPSRTSTFDLYQYWQSTPDELLNRYLRLFTDITEQEVDEIVGSGPRQAQHRLAYEVTSLLRGSAEAEAARAMVTGSSKLDTQLGVVPTRLLPANSLPAPIPRVLTSLGVANSAAEIRRLILQGGLRLNGERVTDPDRFLAVEDFSYSGRITSSISTEDSVPTAPGCGALMRLGRSKMILLVLSTSECEMLE